MTHKPNQSFHVGITRDFLGADGRPVFDDMGLDLLNAVSGIEYSFIDEDREELGPDQIADCDAVVSYLPRFTQQTLQGANRLAIIARFGVGYDMIDIPACTNHDVIVAITPQAVRTPIAEGIVSLILALAKQIDAKQRILREGRWADHKTIYGSCLVGRTLGSVGVGNIGTEMMRLLEPFGFARRLAFDPYCSPEHAAGIGVDLVGLEVLLAESDFVCINCLLNDQTRGLISARELAMMKPTAYLINTARGPIVDQAALTEALRQRQIGGAGLDVFATEPISADDPLLELDNVILLPHAIGWTHEALRGNGHGAMEAVLDVARGKAPSHVVNHDVLQRPGMKDKLARYDQLP